MVCRPWKCQSCASSIQQSNILKKTKQNKKINKSVAIHGIPDRNLPHPPLFGKWKFLSLFTITIPPDPCWILINQVCTLVKGFTDTICAYSGSCITCAYVQIFLQESQFLRANYVDYKLLNSGVNNNF